MPGYEVNSWQGVCAPAATPAALLDKLNNDINSVLRIAEVHQRMEELVMVGPQTTRENSINSSAGRSSAGRRLSMMRTFRGSKSYDALNTVPGVIALAKKIRASSMYQSARHLSHAGADSMYENFARRPIGDIRGATARPKGN